MQRPGFAAPGLPIIAIMLLASVAGAAPAAAFQDASPAAGTPATQPQPTEAAAQPAATAAATPAAVPATTDVVTFVLWYANAADQDLIRLYPLATDANFVAGPAQGAASVGTADFPDEEAPTIVVGDSTFETYPRADGVVERWTWFDDFEGARPGTLVMQLAGSEGTYQDYYGTGTFVSRDEGGVGGVLTIALRPPSPAAAADEAATAEPAADEAAPADAATDAAVAEGAAEPDATVDPETEILGETGSEGAAPVAEGEAPAEPAA